MFLLFNNKTSGRKLISDKVHNMRITLSDKEFNALMNSVKGQALDAVWLAASNLAEDVQIEKKLIEKRDIFINILHQLMNAGELLLAKSGDDTIIYDIPVLEQLELFKRFFPSSEEYAREIGAHDIGTWLVIYDQGFCPLRPVWIYTLDNGEKYLEWA